MKRKNQIKKNQYSPQICVLIQMGDPYKIENPCTKRMSTFYEELIKKGYNIKILAPLADGSDMSCPDVIHCWTVKLKKKSSLFRFLNSVVFAVTSFVKSLILGKFDIVITTSPPPLINISGWMIAKVKRAKLIYDVRDIWPDVAWEMGSFDNKNLYSRVFEFIRDFMLKHSDLITAVSAGKVRKLQEYSPESHIIEIPNGFDENFLKNEENLNIVKKFKMNEKFSCVYVGNLGMAQGIMQLLHIAQCVKNSEIKNVQFILFGTGTEEKALRQYVEKNALDNVIFPGSLPNKDIYTVLKYAQLSFVSLVNENLKDSVPTKLYEALGVGCPVLLAAVGDAADILNDSGLGIAVQPNNKEALWKAFEELYYDHSKYIANKEHAINVILERYSRQKAAENLEKQLRLLKS